MTNTPPPDAGQPKIVCLSCCYSNGISKPTNLFGRCPICHGTGLVDAAAPPREALSAIAAKLTAAMSEAEHSSSDPVSILLDAIDDAVEMADAAGTPLAPPREVTALETAVREMIFAYEESELSFLDQAMKHTIAKARAALNAPARVDENAQSINFAWWQETKKWQSVSEFVKSAEEEAVSVLVEEHDGSRPWAEGYIQYARQEQHKGDCGLAPTWRRGPITCAACTYEDTMTRALQRMKTAHVIRDLSEMRDIRGGEVGEITRAPEEQAALERAMGDVVPNPNALPKEMLPANVRFSTLTANLTENGEEFTCVLEKLIPVEPWGSIWAYGEGPTPRAAMIAAIEAARERAMVDVGKP